MILVLTLAGHSADVPLLDVEGGAIGFQRCFIQPVSAPKDGPVANHEGKAFAGAKQSKVPSMPSLPVVQTGRDLYSTANISGLRSSGLDSLQPAFGHSPTSLWALFIRKLMTSADVYHTLVADWTEWTVSL
jgi:hypothetical protein